MIVSFDFKLLFVHFVGYLALLRYEGFGTDASKDFWVNLCTDFIQPVGWCGTQRKPLIPPKSISKKYDDWKQFLKKRLTGARTLPSYFPDQLLESQRPKLRPGMRLELVDKNQISVMKTAFIKDIIGRRLHIIYEDSTDFESGKKNESSNLLC